MVLSDKKRKIIVASMLLTALVLRLFVLWKYGLSLTLHSDDTGYIRSGRILLEKGMLIYHDDDHINEPTVHIMPGLPILLAAIFFIFGTGGAGLYAAKAVMILFGVSSVYLIYAIGKDINQEWAGIIAGFFTALFVPLVETDNLILTEPPFLFGFLLFIRLAIQLGRNHKMSTFYWLMFSYLFCLLFRATVALIPFALLGYFLLIKYPLRLAWKQLGIAVLLVLIVLGPWWVRNYIHYKEFIPLTGGSGDPLLLGTYQGDGYRYGEPYKEVIKKIDEQYPHITIYEKQKLEKEIAIERIKKWYSVNPKQFIESYTIKKAKIQWETPFYWIEILGAKKTIVISLHKWIVSFAFISMALTLFLLKRNRKELLFFTFIIAYFTILNNVFFAYARYNLPLMPLWFLYIGLLVSAAWHMLFRQKTASP
jgi:4-amino-4-deoxy-L-arabinose transferase-like glycosyltransferase